MTEFREWPKSCGKLRRGFRVPDITVGETDDRPPPSCPVAIPHAESRNPFEHSRRVIEDGGATRAFASRHLAGRSYEITELRVSRETGMHRGIAAEFPAKPICGIIGARGAVRKHRACRSGR